MIPRNSLKAEESVKNDVNAFIPASWKLWALVFESIASKDSHFNEKKNLELIDRTEVDPTSFEDAIMSLYYETCNLVQRKFPIAIYELKNEDSVLLEIKKLVERIRDAYLKAEKFIESEKDNVRRASKKVFENCEYILSILDIKRDMERFEDCREFYLESTTDYLFLQSDVLPLHNVINNTIIENIDFNVFYDLLNLHWNYTKTEGYYEDVGRIRDYVVTKEEKVDLSDVKIYPLPGCGMAMYATILYLMLKRNIYSSRIPENLIETEFGDMMGTPNPSGWADSFYQTLSWKKEWYDVIEDSWKEYYFDGDWTKLNSGITNEEKEILRRICSRATFEDIIAVNNIPSIISHDEMTIGFREYSMVHSHEGDINTLRRIYSCLNKECCYFYNKKTEIENSFFDRDTCIYEQSGSNYRHQRKLINNDEISTLFCEKSPDRAIIYRTLLERNHMFDDNLWEQPIVSREEVSKYLQECIVQDERLKVILYQAINEIKDDVEVDSHIPAPENDYTKDGFEDLRPFYINNKNEIVTTQTRFVRALVTKGFVKIGGKSWEYVFFEEDETKKNRYERQFGPASTLAYDQIYDSALQLAKELTWSIFDGKFTFKGTCLSGNDLKKVFSDNHEDRQKTADDPFAKYKFRIEAFKELYANIANKRRINKQS